MLDALKKALVARGAKLAQSPAVLRLLQNEQVMKGLMGALMLRGKVEGMVEGQVEKLARSLQLATREEVRDLQRALRRLEEQLERRERDGSSGRPAPGDDE